VGLAVQLATGAEVGDGDVDVDVDVELRIL
jgi:hypothetical protein